MEESYVQLPEVDSFLREAYAWYAAGIFVILTRIAVRIRTVGFRNFKGDDYLAFLTLGLYTVGITVVSIAYRTGTNTDVTPANIDLLTDKDVANLTLGSKVQLVAWYEYITLIWTMKFMVLIFYRRLTAGTNLRKSTTYFIGICGATYIACMLTLTFGCFPTSNNWQVRPMPSKACSFKPQNFYVGGILNVLTDVMILAIPIPLLWNLKVRTRKKIAIGLVMCSGLLVVAAAIVRAVITLGAKPSGLIINSWGFRELFVGIFTVNLPIIRPLFRRNFWISGQYHDDTHTQQGGSSARRTGRSRYGEGTIELRSEANSQKDVELETGLGNNSSQENIIQKGRSSVRQNEVWVSTSYEVQSKNRIETKENIIGHESAIAGQRREYSNV